MTTPQPDDRTPERRGRDEAIAAEPQLPPPDLPAGATPGPVEAYLRRGRSVLRSCGAVARCTRPA